VSLLLTAGLLAPEGIAYVDGPPPATTGGFSESSCRMCHLDYDLNDSSGSLRLEGVPDKYLPGQEYTVTIRLAHPQMERSGFEIAARFASGGRRGEQAGSLEATDERVAIVTENGKSIQYARQTRDGSAPESKGMATWAVRWRAPEEAVAPVLFNAAANAANYDDSPLGDFPYTQEATSLP
jgi:hypothetical protein